MEDAANEAEDGGTSVYFTGKLEIVTKIEDVAIATLYRSGRRIAFCSIFGRHMSLHTFRNRLSTLLVLLGCTGSMCSRYRCCTSAYSTSNF